MPTAQNIFLSLVLAPRLQTLLNMDVAFMMSPISVEFLFRSLSISHYVGLLVDGVKFIGVTIFGGKEGSFQQMSSSCIHICWLVLSNSLSIAGGWLWLLGNWLLTLASHRSPDESVTSWHPAVAMEKTLLSSWLAETSMWLFCLLSHCSVIVSMEVVQTLYVYSPSCSETGNSVT